MTDQHDDNELTALLDGLKTDVAAYFAKTAEAFGGEIDDQVWYATRSLHDRDEFWGQLPGEIHDEARRLDRRLVSLMGQIARAVRSAPLASAADQRDVMTGTKAMRAALLLRHFRSWDAEILNDEDMVLGVTPAGQSDDQPAAPQAAGRSFADWTEKISAILDLVAASGDLV
jgi:hypothetical protein